MFMQDHSNKNLEQLNHIFTLQETSSVHHLLIYFKKSFQ